MEPVLMETPVESKRPVILLCVPGNTFSGRFLKCWTGALMGLAEKYEIIFANAYSSQVNFARTLCLGADVLRGPDQKPFDGKIKYDVMFFLDSDMVFSGDMINNLVQKCLHEKNKIISGTYAMDGGEMMTCVENWDEEFYVKNGHFKFMDAKDAEERVKSEKHMVKCGYAGMGCMAIPYGMLEDERMKYPWFFKDINKFTNKGPDGQSIHEGMSEDVSFIRNLIDAGIIDGVWVDLKMRFGHEKMTVF
jgi:hypothetical protein|uniref:Glycosyltransferase n=1 Tax=viral metagenome TaxID=1070528 RepID=A0A6C0IKW1_9ZZZZ